MKLLIDDYCFDYKTSEGINTYIRVIYSELIKLAEEIEFYFMASDIAKIQFIFGSI